MKIFNSCLQHILTLLVQLCFLPWNFWILNMCVTNKKKIIFMWQRSMDNIHYIKLRCNYIHIYIAHNYKMNIKNAKVRIIDEHINANVCHPWLLLFCLDPLWISCHVDFYSAYIIIAMFLALDFWHCLAFPKCFIFKHLHFLLWNDFWVLECRKHISILHFHCWRVTTCMTLWHPPKVLWEGLILFTTTLQSWVTQHPGMHQPCFLVLEAI